MNSKVFMVLRILLGLLVLVYGLNKFLHFIPLGDGPEAFENYKKVLKSANVMYLVGAVEIIAGIALIVNKYGALMALILMSISINAFMAYATFEPEGIVGGSVLVLLNIAVLIGYKNKYASLLEN